jgi:aspartyl-tRNA synthetase
MNEGQFYITTIATNLQTIIDGGGMDKYFQIVKCFRDEDLRADDRNLRKLIAKWLLLNKKTSNVFEGLTRHLLKKLKV